MRRRGLRGERVVDLGDDGRWLGWQVTVTGGRVNATELSPQSFRATYRY